MDCGFVTLSGAEQTTTVFYFVLLCSFRNGSTKRCRRCLVAFFFLTSRFTVLFFQTAVELNVCVEASIRIVLKRLVGSRHILGNDLREAGVPKLSRTFSCFRDPFQNIPEPFEENWYNSIMRHFTSTSKIRRKNKHNEERTERGNIPNAERLRWEYFLPNRLLWKEASPQEESDIIIIGGYSSRSRYRCVLAAPQPRTATPQFGPPAGS